MNNTASHDEPEYGYCQNCGDWIDEENLYVTSYGDVYCRRCGRSEDEAIEEMEDEGWIYYGPDPDNEEEYEPWEDGDDEA